MLCNHPPELFHFAKWKPYPLNNITFPLPSVPGNHTSAFCFYEFDNSRYLILSEVLQYLSLCDWLISWSIIFYKFIQLVHVSEFLSFLRLNNILFYVHTTFCLSIRLFATELKVLHTWGALLKSEPWLWQGSFIYLHQAKETRNSDQKLCLLERRPSHCLCILFGQLRVDFFSPLGHIHCLEFLSVHPVYCGNCKILCYIFSFSKK